MPKYYFLGRHAETVHKGDKVIPVGFGDVMTLTDSERDDDRNSHLKDLFVDKKTYDDKVSDNSNAEKSHSAGSSNVEEKTKGGE